MNFLRAFAALILLCPPPVRACAVCFGAESPDLARGFFWGIVLLLVLPPVMILSFIGVIARHARKQRRPQASVE